MHNSMLTVTNWKKEMKKLKKMLALSLLAFVICLMPVSAADDSSNFGVPEDADLTVSGDEVPVDDDGEVINCAGELHIMSNAQYKEMWNRINKFKAANGRLPNYVTITDMKVGVNTVTQSQFLDMQNRWNAWKNAHGGTEPSKIGIEGSSSLVDKPSTGGPLQTKLSAAVGKFTTFAGFYNLCKYRKYLFYFNDKYTQSEEITRLKNKNGLNCVDSSQLGYALAKEMGYEVKYQRCTVQTKKGPVGHILLKIKGKEFKTWTPIDLAARLSTSTGAPLGKHWGGSLSDVTVGADDGKGL